jgi:hypothetical protein
MDTRCPRAATVAAIVLAGCAHAPWHPYRGWTAWQRDEVVLYSDAALEYQRALDWMSGIGDLYQRTFFRDLPVPPMHVLYLQEEAPSPLTTADGKYRYGAALLGLPRATDGGRGLVLVGRFPWQWDYARFVAHHYIGQAVPGAPVWFQVGFADYLSVFRASDQSSSVVCFGLRQPAGQAAVTPPVRDLFATTWMDYNESSAPWVGPAAEGLIDFLLHGEDARWRPRFRSFMRALAAGQASEQAFATAYPDLPLASLDQRLRDHVRTLRPPNQTCPMPVIVGPRQVPTLPPGHHQVPEPAMRALFQAIEALRVRRGFAEYVP